MDLNNPLIGINKESTLEQPVEDEVKYQKKLSKYAIFYFVFLILHLTEFIVLELVYSYEILRKTFPVGNYLVYLTYLHGLMQTFYVIVCITEILGYNRSEWVKSNIPKVRHWMFGSLAFPIANFVGSRNLLDTCVF